MTDAERIENEVARLMHLADEMAAHSRSTGSFMQRSTRAQLTFSLVALVKAALQNSSVLPEPVELTREEVLSARSRL